MPQEVSKKKKIIEFFSYSYSPFISLFPKDCEMRAEAGEMCVATFDWKCSGVCRSVDRMWMVHVMCGEGSKAVWDANLKLS